MSVDGMQTPSAVILLSLLPLLCTAATCPCGAKYNSQFNKCYNSVSTRKAFVDVEQACEDMDGHLVSIHNGFENSLIMEGAVDAFSSDDFWIGASDVDQQGIWTWSDASIVNYTNWASGYPDGQDGHDCTAVQLTNGKWQSAECFTSKPFVCEIPLAGSQPEASSLTCPSPPPSLTCPPPKPSCPSEWTYFAPADACYKGDWSTAESACHSFGANLTSIHSEEENNFVISISTSGIADSGWTWIGLRSLLPNQYTWSDGTNLDFTKWAPGYPISEIVCVELLADKYSANDAVTFKWVAQKCDYVQRNFVCKKNAMY